jgi:hypothetical protein
MHQTLTYLELEVSYLGEQGLKNLGALPELRYFSLSAHDTVTITVNDGFFCKLRSLVFNGRVCAQRGLKYFICHLV